MKNSHAIYWLKRDFRLADNPALTQALSDSEMVTPIYMVEPSFLEAPETSVFHVHAVTNALHDLRKKLQKQKVDVAVIEGEVIPTLDLLFQKKKFQKIYAHEEIGVERTYARDRAVHKWCKKNKVEFIELRQTAVFRRLKDRNKRHLGWKKFTLGELLPVPNNLEKCQIPKEWKKLFFPKRKKLKLEDLGFELTKEQKKYVQPVSETDANKTLHSFLIDRGLDYRGGISSPLSAFVAGSRMSVHFAWGTMTGRMVYQKTQARMEELLELKEAGDPDAGKWRMSLRSFMSRLHWRDHFIQRLETEPQMEFQALNPAYENLEYDNRPDFLEAWENGMTGYPMVDACIRCLRATGFVNFRMRAMLTSFACHGLHLSWKLIDHPMAKLYTDYEPGIHISQLQMQAGVVGINTLRIYSPTKQIIDQDPETVFIKKWIPELRNFSPKEIIAHEENPLEGYPAPIIERKEANTEMRRRVYAVRKIEGYRDIAQKVYEKHGSRKGKPKKKNAKKEVTKNKVVKKKAVKKKVG